MNRKTIVVFIIVVLSGVLASSVAAQSGKPDAPEAAVTTKFTHQAQIKRLGVLFNGMCDMRFTLWDAATAGTQQATYLPPTQVPVTDGVFAVEVDFGNQFKGEARWIQTEAKCADDTTYTALPRVALNPTPYAIGLMPGAVVNGDIPYGSGDAAFKAINNSASDGTALFGLSTATSGATAGVFGVSSSPAGAGVWGKNGSFVGVLGESSTNAGVAGLSSTGVGVYGRSTTKEGVEGDSPSFTGVWGHSTSASGVVGSSTNLYGVYGESTNHDGVHGVSHATNFSGVAGINDAVGGIGVYGSAPNGGLAARFDGRTQTGVLEITGGGDLAELFDVSEGKADPGTLMVIDADNPGHLTISTCAYDTKVAGVVSGAGDIKPGLTLRQEGVMEGDTEVAIAGRVYMKATASNGAITPGDLLTTSDVPGYAMKATDRDRSPGAIIGKAMTGLKDGTGLVLVLVNLQ